MAAVGGWLGPSTKESTMPTYQYRCTACGHDLEAVQKFSDPSLTECPNCGGELRKIFNAVGVVFKGSGFYRNDSREANQAKAESGSTEKSSASAESGGKETAGATPAKAESGTSESSPSTATKSESGSGTSAASKAPATSSTGSKSSSS